jgi:hypothetical protein
MCSLSEREKSHDLLRKGKESMLKLLRSAIKTNLYEIVKKEKEICASFNVSLQTAKVMATVNDKDLVKMKKALQNSVLSVVSVVYGGG